MLQDLCPSCGDEWPRNAPSCRACGFQQLDAHGTQGLTAVQLRPIGLVLGALAMVALVIVAFGAGMRVQSAALNRDATGSPQAAVARDLGPSVPLGRVRFAEQLGEALELESYRTRFRTEDTIAWRAEFAEPPPTAELTVVIAWQSIRERMQVSTATVRLVDPELTMIASDEVLLSDLVPTAGLYAVSYYSGDLKLAEGVFELLPPGR